MLCTCIFSQYQLVIKVEGGRIAAGFLTKYETSYYSLNTTNLPFMASECGLKAATLLNLSKSRSLQCQDGKLSENHQGKKGRTCIT